MTRYSARGHARHGCTAGALELVKQRSLRYVILMTSSFVLTVGLSAKVLKSPL